MKTPLSRRSFLRHTGLASVAAFAFPAILRSQAAGGESPNERLNIAFVGVGGRGKAAVRGLKDHNRVVFCDVDQDYPAEIYQEYPDVPRVQDYRRMFDRYANQIDAVTVSTPDHMHYPIALAALQLGKHVFVEKPLTHTIWEARQLARLAGEKKVATIMGNQGHANEGPRLLKEWIDAGVLGEVRELHSWTDRPIWPQGVRAPDHSKFIPVVPPSLDWDLWLGVAAERPYDPAYVPFKWRGYWDFGTGALGDMGCHIMDGAFWALGLDAPQRIAAISGRANGLSAPTSSMITFDFPARGGRPALRWTWYDGGLQPPLPDGWEAERKFPENGTLVVGSKATVLANTYYDSVRIVPEARMRELAPALPAKTLPRVEGGHFAEWVRACKGGPAAGSDFQYAAKLTELCLLSNVAVRTRRPVEWDAAAMRVTNLPDANQYLTKQYRAGFGV
ncbi:MAG: Gfo/Idh/MocA family oxidoreductase [Opitutaceae bacterium]|nr:Gfo/Idh/MocA family oxidoreductase [Opitutaceae bacterium]